MERNEVSAAFEIVLEEIETVVNNLNQDGAGAFHKGDYDTAKGLIETATRLTDFRGKVRTLQKEWENLFSTRIPKKPRYALVQEGLMKAGSRQGTWEISQRGKDALARGEIS